MRTKRRWLVRVTIYVSGFSAAKCIARVGATSKRNEREKKWNKLCMHNMRLKLAVIILMVVNFHRIPNTKVNKTHRTRKLLCFYNCWHFAYLLVLHIKWPHTSILIKPFRAQFWFFCSLCLIVFFSSLVCVLSQLFLFCSIRWLVNFLDLVFGLSRMWATKKEVFEVWEIKVVCLQWMKTWMNWRHIPPKRKQQQPPP